MTHVTWALMLAALSTLILIARFSDFLIGPKGDALLRDQLGAFYLAATGDWRPAYQLPAKAVGQFARWMFGTHPLGYFFRVLLASCCTAFALGAVYFVIDAVISGQLHQLPKMLSNYLPIARANAVSDIIIWIFLFWLLKRTEKAGVAMAFFLLIITVLLVPIALFAWLNALIGLMRNPNYDGEYWSQPDEYMTISTSDRTFVGFILLEIAASLAPLILYFMFTLGGAAVALARPILKAPMLLVVRRVQESRLPLLTLGAAAFSAVVGVIGLWVKALEPGQRGLG